MTDSKHVLEFSQRHLKPGETIAASSEGYIGEMMGSGDKTQHNGALIVTGDRVAFYRKGFFGEVMETIPLKNITSIERKSLMSHCTIRIHTSHDALEFKTYVKANEEALVNAIEHGRELAAGPKAQNVSSPLDILQKLAELRDAGILTASEFDKKKAELLAKF